MRIYKVTYTLDLYVDNDFCDTNEIDKTVAAETMNEALSKMETCVSKENHGFKPYKESDVIDGEKTEFTYQYKDYQVKSAELLMESDI